MHENDYWSIAPSRAVDNGGMVRSCHSNIRSNVVTNSSKLVVYNNILLTQHFGRLTKVLVVGVCHSTILQCDPYQMTKNPPIWPSSSSLPLLSCPLKHSRGQSPVRKKVVEDRISKFHTWPYKSTLDMACNYLSII